MALSLEQLKLMEEATDLVHVEHLNQLSDPKLERHISLHRRLLASCLKEFRAHQRSLASPHDQLVARAHTTERLFQAVRHSLDNHRILMRLNGPKALQEATTETVTAPSQSGEPCELAA